MRDREWAAQLERQEISPEGAVILGAAMLVLAAVMWVKRQTVIDFWFFSQRGYSTSDNIETWAKVQTYAAIGFLLLGGIVILVTALQRV